MRNQLQWILKASSQLQSLLRVVVVGLMFLSTTSAMAQSSSKLITGTVVDGDGEPLLGATVMVEGNNNVGTVTDIDGSYSLKVPAGSKTLVFTYLGYTTQTMPIGSKTKIDATLTSDAVSVENVVVVAYGVQSKVSVTGAISAVSSEELKQSPSSNFVSSMSGRLPGLTTVQSSGQPGVEEFQVFLRGQGTTNDSSPLILVDGVPRDNITMLDPNEIASVSILKDASSTAVFGVRGANGVILVTTKTGSTAKPSLSLSVEHGMQQFTTDYETIDSYRFAELSNEALLNDGKARMWSDKQIQLFKDGTNKYYVNTDWFDIMYRKFAPQSRYNANISGSTDRVKYFVNLGMMVQEGMMNEFTKTEDLGFDPEFKLERYNYRTNLNIKINSWIKAGVNLSGYINNVNEPSAAENDSYTLFTRTFSMKPIMPGPYLPESYGYGSEALVYSAYGDMNYRGYSNRNSSQINSSASFDFDLGAITKGLSSKVMASYDVTSVTKLSGHTAADGALGTTGYASHSMTINGAGSDESIDPDTMVEINAPGVGTPTIYPLIVKKTYSYAYKVNFQWAINYNRRFNDVHNVTGLILAQYDNKEVASGKSDLLLPYNVLGVSGRVAYNYDSRYMLEFNAGYNGSEQFAPGKRFGFFPAGSVGWVVSNEEFLKDKDWLSNLKVRASYGLVGNDKLGSNRFLYLDNIIITDKNITEGKLGNPDLTWEVARKQNYGLELGLFDDMLKFNADYFVEDRDKILLTRGTVPTLIGTPIANLASANLGVIHNEGYEMDLTFRKKLNRDLSLTVRGTYSYTKNNVEYLDEATQGPGFAYQYRKTGFSIGQGFGYHIDWNSPGKGYFTSQEEIDNYYEYAATKPRIGDFVYKDINGDKIIDTKDHAPIGSGTMPLTNYSIMVNVRYKNFDLSTMFQGVSDSYLYYTNWGIIEYDPNRSFIFAPHHETAWTPERAESGAKITYPALSSTGNSSSLTNNDFFTQDRSYFRLKNVEIGYTLPKKIAKKIAMQGMRVYVNGTNLATWSDLTFERVDPEQKSANGVSPLLRVFNVGANITF